MEIMNDESIRKGVPLKLRYLFAMLDAAGIANTEMIHHSKSYDNGVYTFTQLNPMVFHAISKIEKKETPKKKGGALACNFWCVQHSWP